MLWSRAPLPGERFICPGQARTLERIAASKGDDFYHGELAAAIDDSFGSFDGFKSQLTQASTTVQGSGWGALAWEPMAGRLIVEQIYDHQGNVGQGSTPILVFDAWEHAFYLQYLNVKGDYVKAWWNVVNWADVTERFTKAKAASDNLF